MEIDINSVDESGLYYKVTDENYDTWSEWISFVESIFCGEYLESAKNNDLYINVDGYTYCRPGSMGWYLSEDYSYSIIENKISEVVISVSYEELSPTATETTTYQTFTYVLKNTDNGWRVSGRISK